LTDPQSGDVTGGLSVSVTSAGGYSGKITSNGKSYSFSAAAGAASAVNPLTGQFALSIPQGKAAPIVINGILGLGSSPFSITGTVAINGFTANLGAVHNLATTANAPSVFNGSYTLALPCNLARVGDTTFPQGNGYATMQVSKSGAATLNGALGDGQPISGDAMLAGICRSVSSGDRFDRRDAHLEQTAGLALKALRRSFHQSDRGSRLCLRAARQRPLRDRVGRDVGVNPRRSGEHTDEHWGPNHRDAELGA
jgi:hypothetical protein